MRALELQDWSADAIRLVERPRPRPARGQVLLRMQAASLNYRDSVLVARGYGRKSGELPIIPVSDGAGTVVELGAGVTSLSEGDLVTPLFCQTWLDGPFRDDLWKGMLGGMLDGVLQDYMVLPEEGVVRAPGHFDARQAATLPCAALTAWNAVVVQGEVGPGDCVVVQGTGGVSLFALQFAKLRGARVILTSSSDEKLAKAAALGADHPINYLEQPEWSRAVRELTEGHGTSHVIEVGGAGTLEQSVRAVRNGGRLCLIGVLSGRRPSLDLGQVATRNLRLQGITVGSRRMHEDMVQAMETHAIVPVIDERVVAFEEVGAAIGRFPQGGHFGKVCVAFD